MFEVGLWVVGFFLFFGVTWFAGKHHSERAAMRRVLKRRGYEDTQLFEEHNDTELQVRTQQARLADPLETTREVPRAPKLRRAS